MNRQLLSSMLSALFFLLLAERFLAFASLALADSDPELPDAIDANLAFYEVNTLIFPLFYNSKLLEAIRR